MTCTIRVAAAGWSSTGPSMGTLVRQGILTKEYISDNAIVWTNISTDTIVRNDYETIYPGQSVTWEK